MSAAGTSKAPLCPAYRYVATNRATPIATINASATTTVGRASVLASCATHSCCVDVTPVHDAVVFRHCAAVHPYSWHSENNAGERCALVAKGLSPHASLKKHASTATTCEAGPTPPGFPAHCEYVTSLHGQLR